MGDKDYTLVFNTYSTHARSRSVGVGLPRDVGEGLFRALPRTLTVFHPNDDPKDGYFNRWLRKGPHEHVYCALGHLASYLRGKKDEDHLALASARLLLAMAREGVE